MTIIQSVSSSLSITSHHFCSLPTKNKLTSHPVEYTSEFSSSHWVRSEFQGLTVSSSSGLDLVPLDLEACALTQVICPPMSNMVDTSPLGKRKDGGHTAIPGTSNSESPLNKHEGPLPQGCSLSGSGGSSIVLLGSWLLTFGDPSFLVILFGHIWRSMRAHAFPGGISSFLSLLPAYRNLGPDAVLDLQ